MSNQKSNVPGISGFTFLELLAVLVLILLVAGLAWPVTQRTILRGRIDAAARELQAELYRTRLVAVRAAAPYAFRYQPGTGVYEILPKEVLDREAARVNIGATALASDAIDGAFGTPWVDAEQAFDVPADTPTPDSMTAVPHLDAVPSQESTVLAARETGGGTHYRKTLPTNVRFGGDAASTTGKHWSPAILFYPNGRTSNARLSIYSSEKNGFRRVLEFRGLTGTIAPVTP